MLKKLCCFMLAFLLQFSFLPVTAKAEADISQQEIDFPSHTFIPEEFNVNSVEKAEVLEKFEKVKELKGKYFTVSKTHCAGIPGANVHGCDNCESTNLIKTDLYDLMPNSINGLPEYHRFTGGIAKRCWSCAAFASITHWYLYAESSADIINVNKISYGMFDEITLSAAKPGDIIALSYASSGSHFHSMIFVEHISGGIRVLDCNWSAGTYGNCIVQERDMKYSSKYTAAVSRSTKYTEETEPEVIYGDADGNGKVNIFDASLVRRYAARLAEIDPEYIKASDVDGDGKINIMDASIIRRYAARLISAFPVEE